jgi:hypothetical protein
MEQVLILALVRARPPVKTSIVVSKRVASDPAVHWGITTSTGRTSRPDAVAPAIQVTVIERRCRLIGQMIGMSPEHLFATSGT